jgi:hypothetical protein
MRDEVPGRDQVEALFHLPDDRSEAVDHADVAGVDDNEWLLIANNNNSAIITANLTIRPRIPSRTKYSIFLAPFSTPRRADSISYFGRLAGFCKPGLRAAKSQRHRAHMLGSSFAFRFSYQKAGTV